MLKSRYNFLFLIAAAILAIFSLLIYVWYSAFNVSTSSPSARSPDLRLFPDSGTAGRAFVPIQGGVFNENPASGNFSIFNAPSAEAILEPSSEALGPFLETFGKIFSPFPPASPLFPGLPPLPASPANAASSSSLTKDEIFDLLYPDFYIEALNQAQAFLIEEGALRSSEKVAFRNEEEVKNFNDRLFGYLLSSGIIDQTGYEAYLEGAKLVFGASDNFKLKEAISLKAIREGRIPVTGTWASPEEAEKEFRELMESQGYGDEFNEILRSSGEGPTSQAPDSGSGRRVLSKYLTGLMNLLLTALPINIVEAKCKCHCSTPLFCFQEGVPSLTGGNLYGVPCCIASPCCGYLGCWNLCGGRGKPFIWDGMLNICGCG